MFIEHITMKSFHFMFQIQRMLVDSFCNFAIFTFQRETLLCSWAFVAGCKVLPKTTIGLDIIGKCIVLELSKNKFKNIKIVSYVLSSTKTYIVMNPSFEFVSKFEFNTNPFSLKPTIQIGKVAKCVLLNVCVFCNFLAFKGGEIRLLLMMFKMEGYTN
jgi:hypothetical protein